MERVFDDAFVVVSVGPDRRACIHGAYKDINDACEKQNALKERIALAGDQDRFTVSIAVLDLNSIE